ncbi:MAG: alpha-galactosidase [Acidobacteria bacterium]|nr:alpha-galactosidase [Acidobacteriota bacterium]
MHKHVALLILAAGILRAEIRFNPARHEWRLICGRVEYRIGEKDGAVSFQYLGPAGAPSWPAAKPRLRSYLRFETGGQVEGQFLRPEDMELVSHQIRGGELLLKFKHRRLPLAIESRYRTWGDTGVFTRQVTITNSGGQPLRMESVPSLAWLLPPGDYELDYLHGGHGEERQLATEKLRFGRRSFVNKTGRSTNGFSPWFCLRNERTGTRYAAQLAYSGNWRMFFEHFTERRRVPASEQDLRVELGMRFDFGGPAPLKPGASFQLPAVAFTAGDGDLDDIANQLHRYQRRYVIPETPGSEPMLTNLNSFYPLLRDPSVAELKKYADIAAELGLESFGMDAGWFMKKRDGKQVVPLYGDWETDPVGYPNGLRELADYVHAKGMRFTVWLEPESVSLLSRVAREHPDWILRYNGVPMQGTLNRVYLDFRRPEVRRWIRAVVDRLVREEKIDWLKIDYNADVGEDFDPSGRERTGTVLYDHLRNLYAWLDAIRAEYPKLIIENCSSGGLRMDLAMIARTHFGWMSDVVNARPSLQLAYGCTLEFAPEVCFHWMGGDGPRGNVDLSGEPGWWDFLFRTHMAGRFGISSRVTDWNAPLKARAAQNVALYKRIRRAIAGADVYHLTAQPQPGENPTGWMALQYCSADSRRSLVLAYRLGRSPAQRSFRLRGLKPEWTYQVSEDGRLNGAATGRQLAGQGLAVSLPAEWRSAVFEIHASR